MYVRTEDKKGIFRSSITNSQNIKTFKAQN